MDSYIPVSPSVLDAISMASSTDDEEVSPPITPPPQFYDCASTLGDNDGGGGGFARQDTCVLEEDDDDELLMVTKLCSGRPESPFFGHPLGVREIERQVAQVKALHEAELAEWRSKHMAQLRFSQPELKLNMLLGEARRYHIKCIKQNKCMVVEKKREELTSTIELWTSIAKQYKDLRDRPDKTPDDILRTISTMRMFIVGRIKPTMTDAPDRNEKERRNKILVNLTQRLRNPYNARGVLFL